jgi:putative transposase
LQRRRFGYRRLGLLLARQGVRINRKKLYRLYKEERLTVRKRGGRKRALGTRAPMSIPQDQNLRWSLDFVMDTLSSGRRFRVLTLVDDFTRECLCLVVDTSLTALRVVRELGQIIESRGCPRMIVSDNGTEFTSNAILAWQEERGIEWHYIAPGKPMQNGFVESFNGRLPERAPVRKSQRDSADHRGMEDRLQHQPTAHEPQRAHTDRVCNPPQQGPNPEQTLLINEGI